MWPHKSWVSCSIFKSVGVVLALVALCSCGESSRSVAGAFVVGCSRIAVVVA